MKFRFDKPTCQNIRKSLRKEWIETNGLGDYASSSLICCNTRKYHGLLVADLESPAGRHVLLSSLEESLLVGGRELCFSCRKHPGALKLVPGEVPVFHYVERKPKGITIEDMLFKAEEILKGLRKLRM